MVTRDPTKGKHGDGRHGVRNGAPGPMIMNREELLSQLRLHGIEDLDGVHRAYLEPGGMVSVIPHPNQETVDEAPPDHRSSERPVESAPELPGRLTEPGQSVSTRSSAPVAMSR